MFGYIVAHKPELKFREFDRYHAYYCGVCRDLKENFGIPGQMTLSYDLTFLAILLTGLYEPEENIEKVRCVPHPFKEHDALCNSFTYYAAAMNVLLAYHKAQDDREDENSLTGRVASAILINNYRKIEQLYPELCVATESDLKALRALEKASSEDIEEVANLFGDVFGRVFRYKDDEWSKTLYDLGFYLGKFVFLLDAYDDIEKDIIKNNYNPLINKWNFDRDNFDDHCEDMLRLMISECTKRFETLPVINDAGIIRNILYAGVWSRFTEVKEKRKKESIDRSV